MILNRRKALHTGLGSLATLAASPLLAENPLAPKATHFPAKAKNVILLYMSGAPSHVDTFDYKPALIKNDGTNGGRAGKMMAPRWKFRQRGQSGLWISDLFPHLSKQADELCLLRGMWGDQTNHPTAERAAHTGSAQFIRPSLGAWSVYGLGTQNPDLPGFIHMGNNWRGSPSVNLGNAFLPARYQATTVNPGVSAPPRPGSDNDSQGRSRRRGESESSSEAIPNIANSQMDLKAQRTQLDFLKRLNQETLIQEQHQPQVEGILQSYELAYSMQSSMPELMNLDRESKATKAMYGLDDPATNTFGTECLLARRMVESGVRFVEIANGGWDHHIDITKLENNCGAIDKPIAGLLADLKQRDMLKDTLVMWACEFGRTPHGTGNGRGHNNKGFTTWMAGGGVKGGFSYGSTDDLGYEAVEGKMHTHDWHATILHLLGLDHKKLTYHYSGRDFRLTDVRGNVAKEILA